MKTSHALFFMALLSSMSLLAMQNTNETKMADTQNSVIRNIASLGSVLGGWAFYWATAHRNNALPYTFKRMPLFIFLASSTALHYLNYQGRAGEPIAHSLKRYSHKDGT